MKLSVVTHVQKPGLVAFTFDDGPFVFEKRLIERFEEANGKMTLFLNGANWSDIADHADSVRDAASKGHQIGSHTWSHPDLRTLSNEEITEQMVKLEKSFSEILGKIPTYMRPPFGYYNSRVLHVLESLGYRYVVMWNINTGDATGSSLEEQKASIDAANPGIGNIILAHETHSSTVDELVPHMIQWAQKNKVRMVTVGELLGDPETNWYKVSKN